MPTNHNGSSSGITAHQQVTIAKPEQGDPISPDVANAPVITLANIVQFLQENAVIAGELVGENILPNTQWQVATGLAADTCFGINGLGTVAPLTVTGFTPGVNLVTLDISGGVGELQVGDLGKFGNEVPASMRPHAHRVISLTANTVTIRLPRGILSSASVATTFRPVNVGGNSSNATGACFDGWSKTTTAKMWRETHTVHLKEGSRYSAAFKKASGSAEHMWCSIPLRDIEKYRGKWITFGVWVKHHVRGGSGTWRARINSGSLTYSSSASTATGWQYLEVSHLIPLAATYFDVAIEFQGNADDVYYISQPMAVIGKVLGSNNYKQPKNEYLIPGVHAQMDSFNNSNPLMPSSLAATDGKGNDTELRGTDNSAYKVFTIDPYAETDGKVAPTVREVVMKIEGRCESVGDAWGLTNNDQPTGAHVFGPLMYSQWPGGYMMQPQKASVPLDSNGYCYAHSGLVSLSGTLTFTNGSATVTGVGTKFLYELSNGMLIKTNTNSGNKFYRVKSRASDTSLTLGVPGGADATFDEATFVGGGMKNNANWYNFAIEINGILLN